ncbi:hypothetical protein C7S18_00475 [Ahniella affigens]|uniref:Lon N-terminal domain-containing protein n=1 Tax=Ahniella affigens TaxID=2021234 RepID=A0A2P1PLP7_9GAMM|nr:LON peptidase substrate-binding domain-containing protein [Ahniella affigens]AVP95761.1 hypothetical protein C7S18_00475 [Ahniella affigens]
MSETESLPLFPLNTVLYPGGLLSLRIFEARYLDLVRRSMRESSPFGIILIAAGMESGGPALPMDLGVSARIVDFCTLPDGLLGITVHGESCFRNVRSWLEPNGLRQAEVRYRSSDPDLPLPPEYSVFELLLRRLGDEGDSLLREADKANFDDAAWVVWRLAERLPLTVEERYELLERTDVHARLEKLAEWLPRFQEP